ncbi:HD domain-containing protein [Cytobacillus sp. FJAT-54145]|uniref:HD domain-containing protein n=1 Tax=Cytobacillus spartinae TaxID=3299023 RepID=A0ABW6KJI3_9BACI
MKQDLLKILEIIKLGEKLKYELRHSWLSNGRQESVAEHTWRVSLMAMLIEPMLKEEINTSRLLKMIIIHDLVEAEAGDVPAFDTLDNKQLKELKAQNEIHAIERIRDTLGNELGQEMYDLWFEFEHKETYESKVANALDKLEAQIQHNEADLSSWIDIEYKMSFMMDRYVEFDPTLKQFKDLIEEDAEHKLTHAGIDVVDLKNTILTSK